YDPLSSWFCPLSLHDALPICPRGRYWLSSNRLLWVQAAKSRLRLETTAKNFRQRCMGDSFAGTALLSLLMPVLGLPGLPEIEPRSESTRLNSSHVKISYAVFC